MTVRAKVTTLSPLRIRRFNGETGEVPVRGIPAGVTFAVGDDVLIETIDRVVYVVSPPMAAP